MVTGNENVRIVFCQNILRQKADRLMSNQYQNNYRPIPHISSNTPIHFTSRNSSFCDNL